MSNLDRDPDDPAQAAVRAALAETGAGLEPKPGWEAKVWERIDAEARNRSGAGGTARSRRTIWLVGGGVLAAAAIALVVWWAGGGRREPIAVADASLEIRRGAEVIRGSGAATTAVTTAAPGDTVVVRHRAAGGTVWIYKGESTLLLGCDAVRLFPPLCLREGAGVVAALELDRPGTYHVVTSVSSRLDRQDAPPTLDEALAALTTAGARFRHDELDVR